MTKAELVVRVATHTQLPLQQAAAVVEGFVQMTCSYKCKG
jgi:hypothetical protein